MASISISTALAESSPFDSTSPAPSPIPHRRRPSRNPNAPPLPSFSFNPGAVDSTIHQGSTDTTDDKSTMPADLATRQTSRALPLPDFKFNPGADLPDDQSPSPTHPVLQEMAMNQQRVSRSARPAPLPAFTFSANAGPGNASPSPTKSMFGENSSTSRSNLGHRRRGSELLGTSNDGGQIISASPERPVHRPQGPPVSGMSRGHIHRRSQAVSISDIDTSELIKMSALAKSRAGSMPTTPTDGPQPIPRHSPQVRQSLSYPAKSPPASPGRHSNPGPRPRVGFADHVDVIPRPLSLISSETEGSSSTVRGSHSLSGSINSLASPSPRPILNLNLSDDTEFPNPPSRPRTADPAALLAALGGRTDLDMGGINLPKRPLSAAGSPCITNTGSPPLKKKHFWFNPSASSSPTPTPKAETPDPLASLVKFEPDQPREIARPRTSPERSTPSLKKRKYHTWTSGIFSRKTGKRALKNKNRRAPTPPTLSRTPSERASEVFDADDTIVIREPSPVMQRMVPSQIITKFDAPSWPYGAESQVSSPVLDLDAALGPFGSEERLGGEPSTKTAASRIAKLHSSERRGTVDAFGTFHRRTESAPSMSPMNRNNLVLHRHGSSSSLAEDVFDEEEEDNFLAGENASETEQSKSDIMEDVEHDVKDVDSSEAIAIDSPPSVDGLGLSLNNPNDGVMIIDAEEDFAQAEGHSSKSTIEAPVFVEDDVFKRPASSPMTFAYPAPQSTYASSTEGRTTSASMISSPDPEHISFDNLPRTTRYLGDRSPDFILQASNDDLPSLSDSISTGAIPRASSSANTRSSVEHRAASVCVPSTSKSNQAWKRSSLASLNRLIPGSSNGSKLKFETVPDPVEDEKMRKKSNRISKLMQFWRSKEKVTK